MVNKSLPESSKGAEWMIGGAKKHHCKMLVES